MVRQFEGEPIHVRIPTDVLAEIDRRAATQGVSRAAVIRQLLKEATT